MANAAPLPDDPTPPRKPRILVVFADGTGNAFATSRTNIWQLYCALDKTDGTQIARYIPGVGTASNRILRMIDGAIGFGVPANVRKLYRFLCWNWQEGDSIMLFGFSRGAFTVRTLAGMIAHQGLMPRERKGRQVTTAEMRSNARGAWRAYRAASTPWVLPTVTLLRRLRNGAVAVKRGLSGQDPHRALEAEIADTERAPVWPKGETDPAFPTRPDKGVRVDFLGVFDTVEAFGMPVDELRRIISLSLYPLSFSNGVCAPSVLCARHALAVDEERLSFRNVSFEAPKDGNGRPWQDVGQRWFPGVHSDIGGGYPDDHGSVLPLTWMLDEAEKAGLRVGPGLRADLSARRFDLAPIHDSRSGLYAAYRYQPRRIGGDQAVDPLLLTKLHGGADLYGPISLRKGCMIADGGRLPAMREPHREAIDGMVFRYRLLNRSVIAILVFLFFCPWYYPPQADGAQATFFSLGWENWWLGGLRAAGLHAAIPIIVGAVLYLSGWGLKDRIRDTASNGWQGKTDAVPRVAGFWKAGARLPQKILEGGFAVTVLMLALAALCASLGIPDYGVLARAHCVPQDGAELAVGDARSLPFDPGAPCAATGIRMREGQRLSIRLQSDHGFHDADIAVPMGGIASPNLLMRGTEWLRRADAPWLAPVLQIGADGQGKAVTPAACPVPAPATVPAERSCRETAADFCGTFVAEGDGPLYLYANDVTLLPGLFYANNSGRATIAITREE